MENQEPIVHARRGTRRQPEASRDAILRAALAEFSQEGLAGARVDAIAASAAVNKALLYYYFHDKESLYGAVLDRFFSKFDGAVRIDINDAGATPGAVMLRLEQAVEVIEQ